MRKERMTVATTWGTPRTADVARATVCVDGYDGVDMSGRLISAFRPEPIPFSGLLELLLRMAELYDSFSFPQRTFSARSFAESAANGPKQDSREVRRYMNNEEVMKQSGSKSTFVVQVKYRQNATWQGTIQWLDKKMTKQFRSTLELVKLMNDALAEQADPKEQLADWEDTDQ